MRGAEAGAIIAVMPSYRAVWMTVHGTSPVDGLERLVAAAQMGGTRPPSPFSGGRQERLVRRNLASGLQLIVQMDRLADDRIVVAGIYWLEGLGDGGERPALPALGGADESEIAQSLHPEEGWGLMPIFQVRQRVEAGELTVDWQTESGFRWPDDVAARLAMAELQAGSLDEVTFQAEIATARAALEGNQPVGATRRLSNLYNLAPGEEGRRTVLQLLYQALLAQPARWELALEGARQTRAHLEGLVAESAWFQSGQILEAVSRDPEAAVALEQIGVEDLRTRVGSGLEAMADLDRALERSARLGEVGQHWDALAALTGLPLESLPAEAGDRVIQAQAEHLQALQSRVDDDVESEAPDEARVARAILRLLPARYEDLHRWASKRWDGLTPQTEILADEAPARHLRPLPDDDDERQTLYTRACLALSTGDRAQARQLLQQVGAYRAAQRLLRNLEEA